MARSKAKTKKENTKGNQSTAAVDVKEKQKKQEDPKEKKAAETSHKSSKKSKHDELTEWKEKAAEINDKYLRLYSEFDNFRKRTLKEKLELSKTASEDIIVDLLPVIDDFERALKAAEAFEEQAPMFEGMELIYNKLKNILEKKGLKTLESKEEVFDTDFHEAVTYIPSPSEKLKGKVVDEIEKGYLLGDKVIRFAKVVIGQ